MKKKIALLILSLTLVIGGSITVNATGGIIADPGADVPTESEEPDIEEDFNTNDPAEVNPDATFSTTPSAPSKTSGGFVEVNCNDHNWESSSAGRTIGAKYMNAKTSDGQPLIVESYGTVDYSQNGQDVDVHIAARDMHEIAIYLDKLFYELDH